MSFLDVTIQGLPQLLSKLNQYPVEVASEVDAEISDAANEIKEKAIDACPVDKGVLRHNTSVNKIAINDYEVVNPTEYAPYVEFGTGDEVNVPTELTEYALQFKGAGVRKVNLPARPFFFPAFFEVRDKLLATIKKVLVAS